MELTNKQYGGLKFAVSRFKDHYPYTCVGGYARHREKYPY